MNDSKLLGCWGAIVGLFSALFLGWMAFELLVQFFSVASAEGVVDALSDGYLHHKLGEWLIVSILIVAVYVGVFRGGRALARFGMLARVPLWVGALLNLVAWLQLPGGTRFSTWALILALLGFIAPWLMSRAGTGRPAQ